MSTDLRSKYLGNTKVKISTIGLGTGTGFKEINRNKDKELIYSLEKALDFGINFIDTAEVYFDGHAEKLIGKAFKKKREKIFIATKFSPQHSSYTKVLNAAEESLKRLQTDFIDLYQIHWPNPVIPIEETLKALEKLVKNGKVKYIGLSNFSLRQLKIVQKVAKLPIVSLQGEYNLLERSIEQEILPFCEKNKITNIAYTPLNSGNILNKEKNSKLLSDLTRKYNKNIFQISLNFLISHTSVIAIPATTNILHLVENVKSSHFMLEKKDIGLISNTFRASVKYIHTQIIKVVATSNHAAYKTVEEALQNKLNFFPSPIMLSEDIQKGDFLKPVKIKRIHEKNSSFKYELINGRIRYWAWVIAFNGKKPIPTIIED